MQILQHPPQQDEHKRLSALLQEQHVGNRHISHELKAMKKVMAKTGLNLKPRTQQICETILSFFGFERSPYVITGESSAVLWGTSCCLQSGLKRWPNVRGKLAVLGAGMKFQDFLQKQRLGYIIRNVDGGLAALPKIKPLAVELERLTELRALRCAAATPYYKDVRAITEQSEQRKVVNKVAERMDRAIRNHRKQQQKSDERDMRMALIAVRNAILHPTGTISRRHLLECYRNELPKSFPEGIYNQCVNELNMIEQEITQLESQEQAS